MPTGQGTFDIDDEESVDENLIAFAQVLTGLDSALAQILTPNFSALSNEAQVANGAILDSLFAATAPEDESSEPTSDSDTTESQS